MADVTATARVSRGERTRARLLDSARVAFRDVGWSQARVEDVCRVAGVGHGTFYAYYANKAGILEALVRQHAAALYALLEVPWDNGAVRSDVRRVIAGLVEVSERDRDIREIWLAAVPSEPSLGALVDEVREQFIARIRAYLGRAVDRGRARDGLDVEVAATALAGMVEQSVALSWSGFGLDVGDRLIDGLTDLWAHAVYRDAAIHG
ncbi:MAG: TetR/AcrR family transcriptional regulator [Mycobacteriales bacterium]